MTRTSMHLSSSCSRRARASAALALWSVASLACAVSVPPGGGPEDRAPPAVAATVPRPDSTGVDPGSEIRISFSEPMQRQHVERLLVVSPPIEIDRVRWEDNTLVIRPVGELVRDTTYVIRLKPEYRDRHGVTAAQSHEFAFATGAAPLDTARIEGNVTAKRAPVAKATVRCYRIVEADTLDLKRDKPDREATANRDGDFRLRYLPDDNARFVVMAFLDKNGNLVYDPETDPSAVHPDTLVIIPAVPVLTAIDFALIDPSEPGSVKGTVVNESGADTSRVMVAMYETADSTRAVYRAVCDSTGAYEISTVQPGSYVLRAFVDIKADSLPGTHACAADPKGCPEPDSRRRGTLHVKAAAVITEPPLVIRPRRGP